MDPVPGLKTSDLSRILPGDVYWNLVHDLDRSLPPPDTDDPGALLSRNHAAIAQVACLLPANAVEAALAGQFVVTNACALHALRESNDRGREFRQVLQCRAQAASMMRQAQGALRSLLRLQAVREKREADGAAAERAAWTEHCAIGLMAEALSGVRPAATAEPPPPPQPEPPVAAVPPAPPQPAPAAHYVAEDEEPARDPIALAEEYARHYPQRAVLIRRRGGVPADVRFGPPDTDIAHALVTGHTPALRELDQMDLRPT